MDLASFVSFLFFTPTMSAPIEWNTATSEVPVPDIEASDEEVIVDVEALQREAQKAMEALLAAAKAWNKEVVHKRKEKEDKLVEERKQAKAKWVADEVKRVADEAAAKKKADDEAAEAKRLVEEVEARKTVSLRKTVVEVGGSGEGAANSGPWVRVEDWEVVQTISALLLCCFIVLTIISADEKTAGDVSRASTERSPGSRGMSRIGSGDPELTCLFSSSFLTEVPGSHTS